MKASVQREIRRLAGGACEYCKLPQAFDPLPFQIDHIIAKQHRGRTVVQNLALATIGVLAINDAANVALRTALLQSDEFPFGTSSE